MTHNNLRRQVAKGYEGRGYYGAQPPAANMRELVMICSKQTILIFVYTCQHVLLSVIIYHQSWDDELATMAQTHAQQCTFTHDLDRNVGKR